VNKSYWMDDDLNLSMAEAINARRLEITPIEPKKSPIFSCFKRLFHGYFLPKTHPLPERKCPKTPSKGRLCPKFFLYQPPCVPRTHPTMPFSASLSPGASALKSRCVPRTHPTRALPINHRVSIPLRDQPLTINSLRATSYELRATNYNALLRVPVPRRLCVKKPVRSPNAPYELFLLTIASASRFGTNH
jgi:hypothetical protein